MKDNEIDNVDDYEASRGHLVRNWVVIIMVGIIIYFAWSKGCFEGVLP